jgi:electron transport complex protein RnfC
MIRQSFFGLAKPRIEYEALDVAHPAPRPLPTSNKVTLLLDKPSDAKDSMVFNIGDKVKTGQKLSYAADSETYVISPVTGTVASLSPFAGSYGRSYTDISIEVDENEEQDNQFAELAAEPTLDAAIQFLTGVPGKPAFTFFNGSPESIHTIIVCGVDRDLMTTTVQSVVKASISSIKSGIRILKQITGVENILMAVPQHLSQDVTDIGAQVVIVSTEYPATLPHLMIKDLLGQVVPAGKRCEDMGVSFFSAEAVASIGMAFEEGRIPVDKTFTFVNKNGEKSMATAKIGTPISDILTAFNVPLNEKDRIIFGGPMTGSTVYSPDYPLQADTDCIIVQDSEDIAPVSDYPCINCGDCVRTCPADIPINLLVRFLEAGQYEEAADEYDLYSCIECGLCSFVCVSKMPVFHYIKLAKYELGRTLAPEATNA